jgi:hypothetical protein
MLGLVATVLSQEEQIFLENILHGKGPGSRLARRIKTTRLKHKPYRNFPLAPNPGFVFAALRKNALAQTANRTKMFHGNIVRSGRRALIPMAAPATRLCEWMNFAVRAACFGLKENKVLLPTPSRAAAP